MRAPDGTQLGKYGGKIRLSANGRFAVVYDGFAYGTTLIDVVTGEHKEFPPWTGGWGGYVNDRSGARVVAGNGTLVFTQPSETDRAFSTAIRVVRASGMDLISLPDKRVSGSACIDADATTVFYASVSTQTGRRRIMSLDLASRTALPLVEAEEDVAQPVATDDGSQLLFLSQADFIGRNQNKLKQAFVTDRAGNIRQLTFEDAGVVEATLSGDGTIAYAVSGDDRILRIQVGTGAVSEVLKRAPALSRSTKLAFGSLAGVVGTAFAGGTYFTGLPLPTKLGGLQVLLNRVPLPLVAVSASEALFQIPWDFPKADTYVLTLDSGPDQVLEDGRENLTVKEQNPAFVYLAGESSVPVMAHTAWDALVTTASPAAVGEIVHFYMTGLGPVSPPVQTGQPGPFGPLSSVTATPQCFFHARGIPFPVQIYWAGLAPGFVGLCQLSVQVPPGMDQHDPGLYCGIGSELDRAVVPVRETPAP